MKYLSRKRGLLSLEVQTLHLFIWEFDSTELWGLDWYLFWVVYPPTCPPGDGSILYNLWKFILGILSRILMLLGIILIFINKIRMVQQFGINHPIKIVGFFFFFYILVKILGFIICHCLKSFEFPGYTIEGWVIRKFTTWVDSFLPFLWMDGLNIQLKFFVLRVSEVLNLTGEWMVYNLLESHSLSECRLKFWLLLWPTIFLDLFYSYGDNVFLLFFLLLLLFLLDGLLFLPEAVFLLV